MLSLCIGTINLNLVIAEESEINICEVCIFSLLLNSELNNITRQSNELDLPTGRVQAFEAWVHHLFFSSENLHLFWISDYMEKHFFEES